MKVIGAGVGRTGTKSLQEALEILGFGKCYHMEQLFRNPLGVKHWKNAFEKKKTDWNALFEGYQAAVDFPVAMYYKELAKYYPDAKFILTVRDPEKWYKSVSDTIFGFDPGPGLKIRLLLKMITSKEARSLFQVFQLNDKSIWDTFFEGKFKDRAYAIDRFNRHNEDVKQFLSDDRLLIYKAGQGWDPICNFLGVEVPDRPYPFSNKKQDFATWASSVVKESLSKW